MVAQPLDDLGGSLSWAPRGRAAAPSTNGNGLRRDVREHVRRMRSLPVEQVTGDIVFSLLNAAQVKLGARRPVAARLEHRGARARASLSVGRAHQDRPGAGTAAAGPGERGGPRKSARRAGGERSRPGTDPPSADAAQSPADRASGKRRARRWPVISDFGVGEFILQAVDASCDCQLWPSSSCSRKRTTTRVAGGSSSGGRLGALGVHTPSRPIHRFQHCSGPRVAR